MDAAPPLAVHPPPPTWMAKPRSQKKGLLGAIRGSGSWNRRHVTLLDGAICYGPQPSVFEKRIPVESIRSVKMLATNVLADRGCPASMGVAGWELAAGEKSIVFACETSEVRDEWVAFLSGLLRAMLAGSAAAVSLNQTGTASANVQPAITSLAAPDDPPFSRVRTSAGSTPAAAPSQLREEESNLNSTWRSGHVGDAPGLYADDQDTGDNGHVQEKSEAELRELVGGGDDEDINLDFDDDASNVSAESLESAVEQSRRDMQATNFETAEMGYRRRLLHLAAQPHDHLRFKAADLAQHLTGDDTPSHVLFSRALHKVGKKDNSQERELLITRRAMYLIDNTKMFRTSVRVIPMEQIVGVIESTVEPTLVAILIPSFHDVLLRITPQQSLVGGSEVDVKSQLVAHLVKATEAAERQLVLREASNLRAIIRRHEEDSHHPLESMPGDKHFCATNKKLYPTFRTHADCRVYFSCRCLRVNAELRHAPRLFVVTDRGAYLVMDDGGRVSKRLALAELGQIKKDPDTLSVLLQFVEIDLLLILKSDADFDSIIRIVPPVAAESGRPNVQVLASRSLTHGARLLEAKRLTDRIGKAGGFTEEGLRKSLMLTKKLMRKGALFSVSTVTKLGKDVTNVGRGSLGTLVSGVADVGGAIVDRTGNLTGSLFHGDKLAYDCCISLDDEKRLVAAGKDSHDDMHLQGMLSSHRIQNIRFSSRCKIVNTMSMEMTTRGLAVVCERGVYVFADPTAIEATLLKSAFSLLRSEKGYTIESRVRWDEIRGVMRCATDLNLVSVLLTEQCSADVLISMPNQHLADRFVASVAATFGAQFSRPNCPVLPRVLVCETGDHLRVALRRTQFDSLPTVALRWHPLGDAFGIARFPPVVDVLRRYGESIILFSGLGQTLRGSAIRRGSKAVSSMLASAKEAPKALKQKLIIVTSSGLYVCNTDHHEINRRIDVRFIAKFMTSAADPTAVLIVMRGEPDLYLRASGGRTPEVIARLKEGQAFWTDKDLYMPGEVPGTHDTDNHTSSVECVTGGITDVPSVDVSIPADFEPPTGQSISRATTTWIQRRLQLAVQSEGGPPADPDSSDDDADAALRSGIQQSRRRGRSGRGRTPQSHAAALEALESAQARRVARILFETQRAYTCGLRPNSTPALVECIAALNAERRRRRAIHELTRALARDDEEQYAVARSAACAITGVRTLVRSQRFAVTALRRRQRALTLIERVLAAAEHQPRRGGRRRQLSAANDLGGSANCLPTAAIREGANFDVRGRLDSYGTTADTGSSISAATLLLGNLALAHADTQPPWAVERQMSDMCRALALANSAGADPAVLVECRYRLSRALLGGRFVLASILHPPPQADRGSFAVSVHAVIAASLGVTERAKDFVIDGIGASLKIMPRRTSVEDTVSSTTTLEGDAVTWTRTALAAAVDTGIPSTIEEAIEMVKSVVAGESAPDADRARMTDGADEAISAAEAELGALRSAAPRIAILEHECARLSGTTPVGGFTRFCDADSPPGNAELSPGSGPVDSRHSSDQPYFPVFVPASSFAAPGPRNLHILPPAALVPNFASDQLSMSGLGSPASVRQGAVAAVPLAESLIGVPTAAVGGPSVRHRGRDGAIDGHPLKSPGQSASRSREISTYPAGGGFFAPGGGIIGEMDASALDAAARQFDEFVVEFSGRPVLKAAQRLAAHFHHRILQQRAELRLAAAAEDAEAAAERAFEERMRRTADLHAQAVADAEAAELRDLSRRRAAAAADWKEAAAMLLYHMKVCISRGDHRAVSRLEESAAADRAAIDDAFTDFPALDQDALRDTTEAAATFLGDALLLARRYGEQRQVAQQQRRLLPAELVKSIAELDGEAVTTWVQAHEGQQELSTTALNELKAEWARAVRRRAWAVKLHEQLHQAVARRDVAAVAALLEGAKLEGNYIDGVVTDARRWLESQKSSATGGTGRRPSALDDRRIPTPLSGSRRGSDAVGGPADAELRAAAAVPGYETVAAGAHTHPPVSPVPSQSQVIPVLPCDERPVAAGQSETETVIHNPPALAPAGVADTAPAGSSAQQPKRISVCVESGGPHHQGAGQRPHSATEAAKSAMKAPLVELPPAIRRRPPPVLPVVCDLQHEWTLDAKGKAVRALHTILKALLLNSTALVRPDSIVGAVSNSKGRCGGTTATDSARAVAASVFSCERPGAVRLEASAGDVENDLALDTIVNPSVKPPISSEVADVLPIVNSHATGTARQLSAFSADSLDDVPVATPPCQPTLARRTDAAAAQSLQFAIPPPHLASRLHTVACEAAAASATADAGNCRASGMALAHGTTAVTTAAFESLLLNAVDSWAAVLTHRAKPSGFFRKAERCLPDVVAAAAKLSRGGQIAAPFLNCVASEFERTQKIYSRNLQSLSRPTDGADGIGSDEEAVVQRSRQRVCEVFEPEAESLFKLASQPGIICPEAVGSPPITPSARLLVQQLLVNGDIDRVLGDFAGLSSKETDDLFFDDSLLHCAGAVGSMRDDLFALAAMTRQLRWPFLGAAERCRVAAERAIGDMAAAERAGTAERQRGERGDGDPGTGPDSTRTTRQEPLSATAPAGGTARAPPPPLGCPEGAYNSDDLAANIQAAAVASAVHHRSTLEAMVASAPPGDLAADRRKNPDATPRAAPLRVATSLLADESATLGLSLLRISVDRLVSHFSHVSSAAGGPVQARTTALATAFEEKHHRAVGLIVRDGVCEALLTLVKVGLRPQGAVLSFLASRKHPWDVITATAAQLKQSARGLGGVAVPETVELVESITVGAGDAGGISAGKRFTRLSTLSGEELANVRCRMAFCYALNQKTLFNFFDAIFDVSSLQAVSFLQKKFYHHQGVSAQEDGSSPLQSRGTVLLDAEFRAELDPLLQMLSELPFVLAVDAELR